jgi:hypothetical protein
MLRKLLRNKLHQSGYNAELDCPEIDYCGWGDKRYYASSTRVV